MISLRQGDCRTVLAGMPAESVDMLCTDPPYGLVFMGKDWDKVVPPKAMWQECLRVLKPGAFAFILCSPRQDCLARMVINLQDAGFETGFTSLYWAYATGFPKAGNIGKLVDKRLGVEREVVGKGSSGKTRNILNAANYPQSFGGEFSLTTPATPQAQALDGSYAGFQPKPAVEVILVAMKPLSEKTYVEQALANGKGITWLDDGRIPVDWKIDPNRRGWQGGNTSPNYDGGSVPIHPSSKPGHQRVSHPQLGGRFPANLLVSDDALDDGRVQQSGKAIRHRAGGANIFSDVSKPLMEDMGYPDSGSFSRYFSLDAWWEKRVSELPPRVQKTFPFLIIPKASRTERSGQLGEMPQKLAGGMKARQDGSLDGHIVYSSNHHPTVKPLALMSYLITLGSRPGDVVLDPFMGSGSTCLAAKLLGRETIGIELEQKYYDIAIARCQTLL